MSSFTTLIPTVTGAVGAINTAVNLVRLVQPRVRKRITYRVHLDAEVRGPDDMPSPGRLIVRYNDVDVPDAKIVLIRLRNDGGADIESDDYIQPIRFTFDDRRIIGVEVRQANGGVAAILRGGLVIEDIRRGGVTIKDGTLVLPPVHLNRKDGFRLVVLLSGSGTEVRCSALIRGGVAEGGGLVRDTTAGTNRFTGRVLGWGGLLVASLVALVGIFVLTPPSITAPIGVSCVAGTISIAGSTAFAPAAAGVAAEYDKACPGSTVQVNPSGAAVGSYAGVTALNTDAGADPALRTTRIAMSDGAPQGNYPHLVQRAVAVIIFSVVVNKDTGVTSLTSDQLRKIYSGQVTNWSDPALGGKNLPIHVIGRDENSGTRNTFDQKVIGSATQPAVESPATSNDCQGYRSGITSGILQCVAPNTDELLKQVNGIPGAIGYAEVAVTSADQQSSYPNVVQVQLNYRNPTIDQVQNDNYPFWTVEYLYTYNAPADGSLAAAFLNYLTTSDTAKKVVLAKGHSPCLDDQQRLVGLCSGR